MELPENMKKVFSHIDACKSRYIDDLAEAVAIKSVSGIPSHREEIIRMAHFVGDRLKKLGASVEFADVGVQELDDGSQLKLPPIILSCLGEDASKKTVLVYCHMDVQPALKEDGWDFNPFELTKIDGKLYGRGTIDDKGPLLGWIHAVEAYQQCGLELPVNLKFCFEGMEECDSQGLEELLVSRKETPFLQKVDYICISDNFWVSNKPCLTYGLRGICYFCVQVECCAKDLHSGVFGGTVHEAMRDLVHLLDSLIDKDGKILIEGLNDDVSKLTSEEASRYEPIVFSVNDYKKDMGVDTLLCGEDKKSVLMAKWRYPSLSIHGIQGAFAEPGSKTVIPRKVTGKFSIRIVPNQTPSNVEAAVKRHFDRIWQAYGSPNKCSVTMTDSGRCWVGDVSDANYTAGKIATKMVYGVEPDLTRIGGSIPIAITLEEVVGKNVLMLPMGGPDDGAHSQNEKIDERNYIEGTKLIAAYVHQLSN